MPETERLIRNGFVDTTNQFEEILPYWKKMQLVAFKDSVGVEDLVYKPEDVEWLKELHETYGDLYTGYRRYIETIYNVKEPLHSKILNSLPDIFKDINVSFKAQIFRNGDYMMPHRDHERTSGLYFVMSPPDFKTCWYEMVGEFTERDLKYAPPENLNLSHTEVLQRGSWYLFNNHTHHSVHRIATAAKPTRKTFVIQLDGLRYEQSYEIFKDYETKMD
jgi:hypothetical protein